MLGRLDGRPASCRSDDHYSRSLFFWFPGHGESIIAGFAIFLGGAILFTGPIWGLLLLCGSFLIGALSYFVLGAIVQLRTRTGE